MMKSVGESMRWLVEEERRFPNVEEAWGRFLDYLAARHGVGLAGFKEAAVAEIETHLDYVEGVIDESEARRDSDAEARLEAFGQRLDVIEVFARFCTAERLPSR